MLQRLKRAEASRLLLLVDPLSAPDPAHIETLAAVPRFVGKVPLPH